MRRGRSKNPNENPGVRPVIPIELSEKAPRKKLIAVVILLAIGLSLIGYSLITYLSKTDGWTEIEVTNTANSCSSDLVFRYDLGRAGLSATAEHKAVVTLYTELCQKAYSLFQADKEIAGTVNLAYINRHIGEELTVDDALYQALSQMEEHGSRLHYTAPMTMEYVNLFSSEEDSIAIQYDPFTNEALAAYLSALSAFVRDEKAVKLELLGDNRVCLSVSEEYRAFADENGISSFVDFGYMKNAWILDYIADALTEKGFTFGTLSSLDGFTRNLDERQNGYTLNLFRRQNHRVYSAARFRYVGKKSFVFLHAYPLLQGDEAYYVYGDGTVRHTYLDLETGLCANVYDELLAYSSVKGCAETLLSVLPYYDSPTLDKEGLGKLRSDGIYAIAFDGSTLYASEDTAVISDFYADGAVRFERKPW